MEHLYKQCERAFGFKVKALMSFESLGAEILKARVGCVRPARQGWAAGVRRGAHRGFTPRACGATAPLPHGHSRAVPPPAESPAGSPRSTTRLSQGLGSGVRSGGRRPGSFLLSVPTPFS